MKARDVLPDLAAGMFIAAVMCVCTSLYLATMAEHACGPAAYAVPSEDVVHGGPLMLATTFYAEDPADSSETNGALPANLIGVWSVRR